LYENISVILVVTKIVLSGYVCLYAYNIFCKYECEIWGMHFLLWIRYTYRIYAD
jgi:hypothetical protein